MFKFSALALAVLAAAPALTFDAARSTPPVQAGASTGEPSQACSKHPSGTVCRTQAERAAETVDVKEFGAIGDGVSRPLRSLYPDLPAARAVFPAAGSLDEELDAAAINKTIGTAAATGAGAVRIPPGTYLGNVVLDKGRVDLVGSSNTVLRPTSGTALTVKSIIARLGGVVRDLKIDGAGGTDVTCLSIEGFSHGAVENVDLDNCAVGVSVNGDKSTEFTLRDLVITAPRKVGFGYYRTNDTDTGGVYISGMRIAGSGAARGFEAISTHAKRTTTFIYAEQLVIDGRADYGLYLKNVENNAFSQVWVTGTVSAKSLVYFENTKDTQLQQAWIQNSARDGYNVEFSAASADSADLQLSQLRLSTKGTDFFYSHRAAPMRSRITDVASTTVQLGGSVTNDPASHAGLIKDGPVMLRQSATPVSLTGTRAKTPLATVTVPRSLMGTNGRVEITHLWSSSPSAGSKAITVTFGGVAYQNVSIPGNAASYQGRTSIQNRGSPSSQVGANAGSTVYGASSSPVTTSSIDTNADVRIALTGQLADGADRLALEALAVTVYPAP